MDIVNKKTKMKTVLVTGPAGFIGSHLSEKLLSLGYKVIGVDNFDPFYSRDIKTDNMENFMLNPNFYFYELDLCNNNSLDQLNHEIDLVIHLAGKAGVRPSILDPQSYIDSNISATRNILDFMRIRGIQKMAFASSSSVYGNNAIVPFTEDQNVDNVISPYAFSKKSCEILNHSYHHLYDLDIINMRFFTVFGPRQRPDLAINKFMSLMTKEEAIPVFGDGTTARDYTYVDDTVNGIINCCEYLFSNQKVFNTLNLGNSFPITLSTMIETIATTSGIRPIINRLPMQAGDVNQTFADISKAKDLVGYTPKITFVEGISRFVKWFTQKQSILTVA